MAPKLPKHNNKPETLVYGLLAQVSLIHNIPLYLPSGDHNIVTLLQDMGAKVSTSQLSSGSALYYKHAEGSHYLKLVGPNCPKGGGLYLANKLSGPEFILWAEAFTRGVLLRDIRDRVNNPSEADKEMLAAIPNDPFNVPVSEE